jgi:hypothetical protein
MSDYADFSDEVLAKARRLVDSEKVSSDADHPGEIFWVVGSAGNTYRVQVGQNRAFVTCTCPHGLHTGGGVSRCYHAAAAMILMDRAEVSSHGFGKDE